jgi:hypothetical protein
MRPGSLSGSALTRSSRSRLRRSPRTRVSLSTVRSPVLYPFIGQGLNNWTRPVVVLIWGACVWAVGFFLIRVLTDSQINSFWDPGPNYKGCVVSAPSASSHFDVYHDDHVICFPSRRHAGRAPPLSASSFISIMAHASATGRVTARRSDGLGGD